MDRVPAFPLNVVPVAEKVGAPVPVVPTSTPAAFPSTAPPVKVNVPSTTATPATVDPVTRGVDAVLSTPGATASTRIPVAAPSTVTSAREAPQYPEMRTPAASRAAGLPSEAAAIRTVVSDTGSVSAEDPQAVVTPSPLDAAFRISKPAIAPPGPISTSGPVSAAAVVIA